MMKAFPEKLKCPPNENMIRVSVSSDEKHLQMWRSLLDKLEKEKSHINIISSWVREQSVRPSSIWSKSVSEIISSDYLLVYCEENDNKETIMGNIGSAIAYGIPVLWIGNSFHKNNIVLHPCLKRFFDIDDAISYMRSW